MHTVTLVALSARFVALVVCHWRVTRWTRLPVFVDRFRAVVARHPVSEVENTLTIACVYDMPIDMGDVSPVGSRRLHRCDLQVLLQRRARVILVVVVSGSSSSCSSLS